MVAEPHPGEAPHEGVYVHRSRCARTVGLCRDTHGQSGEVRSCAAPAHTTELVTWLRAQGKSVSLAYEAGPTGFGLERACEVARTPYCGCPSRIPRAPGERDKSDRRDALKLVRLLRSRRAHRGARAQP